jgi:hypothetical protein
MVRSGFYQSGLGTCQVPSVDNLVIGDTRLLFGVMFGDANSESS